ncbi:hypothetical protein DMN91_011661 [Ooceraea biroi]|uniref:Uncharacterized protein n=1 Tax=Ooceraea biroi TaxID=2015173 RepID=A0A3L8D623_OOCBI|nr:hypothetical protein DMN91_011661 [Ooceraea biroi]
MVGLEPVLEVPLCRKLSIIFPPPPYISRYDIGLHAFTYIDGYINIMEMHWLRSERKDRREEQENWEDYCDAWGENIFYLRQLFGLEEWVVEEEKDWNDIIY